MDTQLSEVIGFLFDARKVAIFTGAGVSTLCGIPDFRGPQGLYKQPDAERIFDIDWFIRDPSIYYNGCRELVYGLKNYKPGPVHTAIVALEKAGFVQGVITQNIDMLHQAAGSKNVYEVHGSPIRHHCFKCGREASFLEVCKMLETQPVARCEVCGGPYKPDITFFGETLPETAFRKATELAESADLMVVLGSSLTVQPAASIPMITVRKGGRLLIVNGQPTPLDRYASARSDDLLAFAEAVHATCAKLAQPASEANGHV